MTSKPPSPWDKASIRLDSTRQNENKDRRLQDSAGRRQESPAGEERAAPRREGSNKQELRYYGLNAVQAVFARRPEAIRKLYLVESRIPQLQPLLGCACRTASVTAWSRKPTSANSPLVRTTRASSPTCCG